MTEQAEDLVHDLLRGAAWLAAGGVVISSLLPVSFWFACLTFAAIALLGWSVVE